MQYHFTAFMKVTGCADWGFEFDSHSEFDNFIKELARVHAQAYGKC